MVPIIGTKQSLNKLFYNAKIKTMNTSAPYNAPSINIHNLTTTTISNIMVTDYVQWFGFLFHAGKTIYEPY